MRASQFLIATVKETPSDAVVISHQLMLRAGMIRKLSTGLYSWLPMGLRVLRKVEAIVREEMNKAGAQELLMPVVQPAELWQESGRWQQYGPELLRITDRHSNRDNLFLSEDAVSDSNGEKLPFYASSQSSGISSLIPFHETHKKIATIEPLLWIVTATTMKFKRSIF